jgi:hypothetical protein
MTIVGITLGWVLMGTLALYGDYLHHQRTYTNLTWQDWFWPEFFMGYLLAPITMWRGVYEILRRGYGRRPNWIPSIPDLFEELFYKISGASD